MSDKQRNLTDKEMEDLQSRASKMNGYRSMVSRQKNDVFKFKPKKKKKG